MTLLKSAGMLSLFSGAAVLLTSLGSAQAQTVKPVSASGLQKAIAASKGKVVLVNFWATWCPPCIAELPALSRLQRNNAKKGLKVLLVSGDEASATSNVKKVLKAKGHTSSYLIKGDMLDFFAAYDPKDKSSIALPRTYIFDRKGKRVKMIEGDHTEAEFKKLIAPYL